MAAMLSSLMGDASPSQGGAAPPPSISPLTPPEAPRRKPVAAGAPSDSAPSAGDAMFSLKLDDGAAAPEEPVEETRPRATLPKAVPAAAPSRDDLPQGVAPLAPPRRKNTAFVDSGPRPRSRRLTFIVAGAVGVVVLTVVTLVVMARLRTGPVYAKILAPFDADLARDHYPAYQQAAEALIASGDPPRPVVRAAAAELLLQAALGRGGEKTKITRAEELMKDIPSTGEMSPEVRRAHALLSVARGKGTDAEQLMATLAGTPEAQLVSGLRRLRERKPELAVAPLRGLADASGTRLLPRYLLGLALEESRQSAPALKAYERVLAGNRDHAGAQVGKARLQAGPPHERRAAAEELIKRITGKASPGELAEVQTLQGATTLALGRAAEAVEVLSRAVTASPSNAAGQAYLAEALIADGRPVDALGRLRLAEPGVLRTFPVRIAMAAALIANGQLAEGTSQIEALGPAASDNPRVPYWLGVAAETGKPPDLETASRRYRAAVELDPRYLPAALRLAALLQKQGKADKALALIQDAEKAGVAPEALELAWGQALIAARNPQEAEAVFRKAVARAPKLPAARIGLAAALEEGGKLDEAESELERAATELKTPGLRDRLAELLLKRGKKQAALAAFEAELASGNNDPTMRVRLAKLALDMGKLERAARELEMVTNESPGTPEAYFTLGRVREAAGEVPRALKEYRSALLYESFPQLHLALGRTLGVLGKEDDALVHLGSAGDLAAARLERARIRLRRGRVEEALIDAEAAARLEPGNGPARFVHGLCLDLLGRADDAAAAWRAAIKVAPHLAEAYYRVGRYEMDKGRPTAAIEYLRQAASRRPSDATWEGELYFQLALAELNGGSRTAAAAALRRYLEVAPPDAAARPEAERMLAKLPGR
jgi:tetratricopeptide (TPR) repeat protein